MADPNIPPVILERLQQKYRERLVETATIVTPLVRRVLSRVALADDYDELRAQARKLAGSGASYGFGGLSECGRRLDLHLKASRDACDALDVLALDFLDAVDEALGIKNLI